MYMSHVNKNKYINTLIFKVFDTQVSICLWSVLLTHHTSYNYVIYISYYRCTGTSSRWFTGGYTHPSHPVREAAGL